MAEHLRGIRGGVAGPDAAVDGVAGALRRARGGMIERETVGQEPIAVGESVITTAGALPARCVIHAATMSQDLTTSARSVELATASALERAREKSLRSIAFPALGTGVGALSFEECARAMRKVRIKGLIDNRLANTGCTFTTGRWIMVIQSTAQECHLAVSIPQIRLHLLPFLNTLPSEVSDACMIHLIAHWRPFPLASGLDHGSRVFHAE